jgi:hypothetical protein
LPADRTWLRWGSKPYFLALDGFTLGVLAATTSRRRPTLVLASAAVGIGVFAYNGALPPTIVPLDLGRSAPAGCRRSRHPAYASRLHSALPARRARPRQRAGARRRRRTRTGLHRDRPDEVQRSGPLQRRSSSGPGTSGSTSPACCASTQRTVSTQWASSTLSPGSTICATSPYRSWGRRPTWRSSSRTTTSATSSFRSHRCGRASSSRSYALRQARR